MSMFSVSLKNSCITPSFSRSHTAPGSLCTTSSGELRTSTSTMWRRWRPKKLSSTMNASSLSSAELLSPMKGKFSALVDVTRIMCAAIGCLSMITWSKSLSIDHHCCSDALTSRLCTLREAWSLSLEEMMPSHSTQLAKNTTSRMTTGRE